MIVVVVVWFGDEEETQNGEGQKKYFNTQRRKGRRVMSAKVTGAKSVLLFANLAADMVPYRPKRSQRKRTRKVFSLSRRARYVFSCDGLTSRHGRNWKRT